LATRGYVAGIEDPSTAQKRDFKRGRPLSNLISAEIPWVLSLPQTLLLAMITISIEIHFTTLYMADLGTRAEMRLRFGMTVFVEVERKISTSGYIESMHRLQQRAYPSP
jgi:hypothetical protein